MCRLIFYVSLVDTVSQVSSCDLYIQNLTASNQKGEIDLDEVVQGNSGNIRVAECCTISRSGISSDLKMNQCSSECVNETTSGIHIL